MEPKEIRELIDLISRSNFNTFELEHDGIRLKLVKDPPAPAQAAAAAPVAAPAPAPVAAAVPAEGSGAATPPAPSAGAAEPAAPKAPAEEFLQITSPIVGTFYSSPSPDAPAFVSVGDRVSKGQVVCIVEAMKVMNEIESEFDAEVVEVVVANGQPVEFGETLLRLRPLS